jgi:nickel/cobalt transporter (NiCoT) family protein
MRSLRRLGAAFDRGERRRLAGLGGVVFGLHALGGLIVLVYASRYPVLVGLGALAYSFGLRHAFDADHISAIDNTTRKLLSRGERPLAVGLFFSLGHSTIVFALTLGLAVAASAVHAALPSLQVFGGTVGAGISGLFLWAIGLVNLITLTGIVRLAAEARRGRFDERGLESQLLSGGLMSRLLARPLRLVRNSRQMYPVGALFGLGFDTATEVGLLAITAGAASGHLPPLAIMSLPTLFAAGMSMMDTADGVFMSKAYGWAFDSPVRRIYYNLVVTALSVLVALLIGTIELAQVMSDKLGWHAGFWGWLQHLDFAILGYAVVALFAASWLVAWVIWRWRRVEQRWQPAAAPGSTLPWPAGAD